MLALAGLVASASGSRAASQIRQDADSVGTQQYLDRLVASALSANPPGRHQSAASLMMLGRRGAERLAPGVVRRAAQVYWQTSDPVVKGIILNAMSWQVEDTAAIGFLVSVVRDRSQWGAVSIDLGSDNYSAMAIGVLADLGEAGAAALRALASDTSLWSHQLWPWLAPWWLAAQFPP